MSRDEKKKSKRPKKAKHEKKRKHPKTEKHWSGSKPPTKAQKEIDSPKQDQKLRQPSRVEEVVKLPKKEAKRAKKEAKRAKKERKRTESAKTAVERTRNVEKVTQPQMKEDLKKPAEKKRTKTVEKVMQPEIVENFRQPIEEAKHGNSKVEKARKSPIEVEKVAEHSLKAEKKDMQPTNYDPSSKKPTETSKRGGKEKRSDEEAETKCVKSSKMATQTKKSVKKMVKRSKMVKHSGKAKGSKPKKAVVIHVSPPNPDVDPIVASFPGGIPLNCGQKDGPSFSWYRLNEDSNDGRMLLGQDRTNLYEAASMPNEAKLSKLCVGVYNKKTGKLTLHQAAEGGTVFAISQQVLNYKDSSAELAAQMSAADRRRALFESFGSSKKRKVLKSQAANEVNVETVVGSRDLLAGALPGMSESNRLALEQEGTDPVEAAYAEARLNFLPPFDADAKEPHLVYDPRDIAGDKAWAQVTRVIDVCRLKGGNIVVAVIGHGKWHESVQVVLRSMAPEGANTKQQIRCSILLNYMMNFYQRSLNKWTLRGTSRELAKYLDLPIEITERFVDLFTVPITDDSREDQYSYSKQSRDKCLVYMFLLYLMAHGNEMRAPNILLLSKDLKIEPKQAVLCLKSLGCEVKVKSHDVVTAALTVPLTFPAPKRGRRPV